MNFFWSESVPYISQFGPNHLLFIAILLICIFLLFKYHHQVRQNADFYRKLLLTISLGQQILLYSWYIFETGFDISESLPLHISRITSILGIIYLFTLNKKMVNVTFYFGLFAYGTFMLPSLVYPIYHAMGLSFLINHVITIIIPMFAYIVYDWRPSVPALFKAYGWFVVYFAFVSWLNPLIDGNYFYLKHRPFLQELPNFWYNVVALVGTFAAFWLGYGLVKVVGTFFQKKSAYAQSDIATP